MKDTPIRRQYLDIKKKYPDSILLFRLGDFYEAFDDDAITISRELDLVLTSREMGKGKRYPMAGIPHHSLDSYIGKLINKGYRVAICEQLSEPKPGKGLVERDVVRVITPGTVMEPGLLKAKVNNYLLSLVGNEKIGLAFIDITTGEFKTTEIEPERLMPEIERLSPAELLITKDFPYDTPDIPTRKVDEPSYEDAREKLLSHFGTNSLEGFGCEGRVLSVKACSMILSYLEETQKSFLPRITSLSTYSTSDFMVLDAQTRRNLEITQSIRGDFEGSLLWAIDMTLTPMGGRLLRKWITEPLLMREEIERRLDGVQWFFTKPGIRAKVRSILREIGDMERILTRTKSKIAYPKELLNLKKALLCVPKIKNLLEGCPGWIKEGLSPCEEVSSLIERAINDEPSQVGEGGVIKEGFSEELDRLKAISSDAKKYLAELERKERERTGIKSLKIGYNKVFGYYIEVTKPNLSLVPPDYIRRQTLSGAERFITPELKEYEALILNSEERIGELERSIYARICEEIGEHGEAISRTSSSIALIDVLSSLSEVASRYNYTRPEIREDDVIEIKEGRHPVVERYLGGEFVPNDTYLSKDDQILIITGPNMSGKSTYLRQVALIVLLAQIGSFVPAKRAKIGIVDRIFTRIGLQDDLALGRSTFMVEMEEMANILNNSTPRSLLILDEVGRGTSTYDGLSIAIAVTEYIHNKIRARTLFATHYHELAELPRYLARAKNYNFAVAEEGGRVVFLYRVIRGSSSKSYGIYVAELAGLPKQTIELSLIHI